MQRLSSVIRKAFLPTERRIWRPLDTSKREFRLLEIEPSRNPSDTVAGRLHTVSLDEVAQYEALSYCWGEEPAATTVKLGDESWKVTDHLADALRQLRHPQEPRTMFVDALCIDQTNVVERNTQVPLMGRIFGRAHHVHGWLGHAYPGVERTLKALQLSSMKIGLHEAEIEGRPFDMEDWKALLQFLSFPYWTRTWIIQEVVLAQNLTLHCGAHQLGGEHFPDEKELKYAVNMVAAEISHTIDLAALGLDKEYLDQRKEETECLEALNNVLDSHIKPLSGAISLQRRGTLENLPNSFLINHIAATSATVPHDYVYALLGLFDSKFSSTITPAYEKSVEHAFQDFAWRWMHFHQDARMLTFAAGFSETQLCLPSWVPDFSQSKDLEWLDNTDMFVVNDQIKPEIEFNSHGCLQVRAHCIDYVDAVHQIDITQLDFDGEIDFLLSHHEVWREFFDLTDVPDAVSEDYPTGGTLEDNYWRLTSRELIGHYDERGAYRVAWLQQEGVEALKSWMRIKSLDPDGELSAADQAHVQGHHDIARYLENKHFFKTAKGYIGVTDSATAPVVGDGIFLIPTTANSFLLREVGAVDDNKVYQVVSSAYVQGLQVLEESFGRDDDNNDHSLDEMTSGQERLPYAHLHVRLATSWEEIWLA